MSVYTYAHAAAGAARMRKRAAAMAEVDALQERAAELRVETLAMMRRLASGTATHDEAMAFTAALTAEVEAGCARIAVIMRRWRQS